MRSFSFSLVHHRCFVRVIVLSDNPIGYHELYRRDGYCADGRQWVFADAAYHTYYDHESFNDSVSSMMRSKCIRGVLEMMWHYAEDSFDRGYFFCVPDTMMVGDDNVMNMVEVPFVGE